MSVASLPRGGGHPLHTDRVRIVVVMAVAALLALLLAVITGSSTMAVLVVALAVLGIVALVRDWRADRTSAAGVTASAGERPESGGGITADELSPDISTDPAGPSSDARAD